MTRRPTAVPRQVDRSPYRPPLPGGIELRADLAGRPVESVHVDSPSQAVRWMRRTARNYVPQMTTWSRLSAQAWRHDGAEMFAALTILTNRLTYKRSWTLQGGDVLTVVAVPPPRGERAPVPAAAETGDEPHTAATQRGAVR